MFPLAEILLMIIQGLPSSILNPYFWIVIFLVWTQYQRAAALEIGFFGTTKSDPRQKVLRAAVSGTIGGLVGSIIVVLVGISITEAGLIYVWPLALILALIDPHFMCFSYAGGIVSLSSLILGFPRIDVAGLMALVAVLHLVESLLIYFTGHLNATAIYINDPHHGVVGGFSLQEFWPVPIMLLMAVSVSFPLEDTLAMPDWWPLIKPPAHILEAPQLIFMMMPVVAALGYGDIALTTTPRRRCKTSAVQLLVFSGILLGLSVMASRHHIYSFVAAAFAPLAHETLIILGQRREKKNPPLFVPSPRGERVLFVEKGSNADNLGLSPGDLLLEVNGRPLISSQELTDILAEYPPYLWIIYETPTGDIKTSEIQSYPYGIGDLGIVLVPRDGNLVPTVEIRKQNPLSKIIRRIFNKG